MPHPQLDRFQVRMQPLSARPNKFAIEEKAISPDQPPTGLADAARPRIAELADRIRAARSANRPVVCAFGAHSIKNGLGPVFVRLMEGGWLTHLATNGAGIIHDWEFAWQGRSCEDVRQMVHEGRFGLWEETGYYLNLALNIGAYEGRGYGESVGSMIEGEGLAVPSESDLRAAVTDGLDGDPERAAAAADLLWVVRRFELEPGRLDLPHRWKLYSAQAGAHRLGVPLTGHPMFGHDIIYSHPMNRGGCLGRCAQRDFLAFAESIRHLDGGVYLSVGSAVMSPMIFEKSLAMAQNLAIQAGDHIDRHFICVVDLAPSTWDWSQGEPPEDNPAYYLRYNKTFARMGGEMRYVQADNREFLLALLQTLEGRA